MVGAVLLMLLLIPLEKAKANSDMNEISVMLRNYLGNQTEVTVTIRGEYKIAGESITLTEGNTYNVKVNGSQLDLYNGSTKVKTFTRFTALSTNYGTTNYLRLKDNNSSFMRAYLGDIEFTVESISGKNYVRPINTLPIDDYIKGVVPGEMYPNWHIEAYKAQAVAARSYALNQKLESKTGILVDTVSDQVYEGYTWWQTNQKYIDTTKAINATKGQYLTFSSKPILATYSSTNGGKMLSVRNAWGTAQSAFTSTYPYLTLKEDPYSAQSGAHMNWSFTVDRKQTNVSTLTVDNIDEWWAGAREKNTTIMDAIKAKITPSGSELKIIEFDNLSFTTSVSSPNDVLMGSFTVRYFEKKNGVYVKNANGELQLIEKTITQRSDTLRSYFGNNGSLQNLRSPNVQSVSLVSGVFTVKGNGFGHGIGMSQYGAQERAKVGQSYSSIINFYYPGVTWTNTIDQNIVSLSGATRYETSASIANYGWSNASTVVIGRGDKPVDALTGSVLAKKYNAPLLLVSPNSMEDSVKKQLDQYKPSKIYILGGTSAISTGLETYLKSNYTNNVVRVSGPERADTAVEVAKQVGKSTEVYITSDQDNSPDALSIASYAAREQKPVLLSSKNALSNAVVNYIKNYGVSKVTIIGGPAAISANVETQLKGLVGSGNVTRISGEDRFETSAKIVDLLNFDSRNLFLAQGYTFIDALPGSVLAATLDAPILLVEKNRVPSAVTNYINTNITYIPKVHYLGGTEAISAYTRDQIKKTILD